MNETWQLIRDGYSGYADYLWQEITNPSWHNYFYWLLGVSAVFFVLELVSPWRRDQPVLRKDFWLDLFYMFFNFFLFSLVIYNAASNVVVHYFNSLLESIGITNLVAFEVMSWPVWAHLLLGFVVRDFIQWWTHRLLHRVPWLWEFHKVHHSVEEMGFAAHLRYHWMETIVYRTLEYIPLALIGIGLRDFFIIHIVTLAIGHFNHSNIRAGLGPLRFIFNNPQMHIWHHAYDIPEEHPYGVNFGISLALWDYLFGTAYIPFEGKNIRLGFRDIEKFPHRFWSQVTYGFRSKRREKPQGNRATLVNIIILFMFFLSCSPAAEQRPVVSLLTPQNAMLLLQKEEVQIIDVRTKEETADGMLEHAIHMDVTDPAFPEMIATLDPDRPLLVYCASGMRSARASQICLESGFSKVFDLEGGIRFWQQQGYTVKIP